MQPTMLYEYIETPAKLNTDITLKQTGMIYKDIKNQRNNHKTEYRLKQPGIIYKSNKTHWKNN